MSKQEVHEIHEHAHAVEHNPQLMPVTITMAILAVLIAAASLFGHRSTAEGILYQNKASDQWAYYQAKNIRKHSYTQFADLLGLVELKDKDKGEQVIEKYKKEADRYDDEQKEIEKTAREFEDETKSEQQKANRFDLGEIILEASLVITSVTMLTKIRIFWFLGILTALVGVIISASGFWVH